MNPVTLTGDCLLLIPYLKLRENIFLTLNYSCILYIHRFIDRALADRVIYRVAIW